MSALRHYVVVTGAYWAFTLSDGALRMLVLLHFHGLGYSAVRIAFLFLFYEAFGVITNLVAGRLASHLGLTPILWSGLALQIIALCMLAGLSKSWATTWSVAYVMASQALSGIAKDLTKMSAKSSVKHVVPTQNESKLFAWVALLTGSKNALKGAGFFLGGLLLSTFGFRGSLVAMAGLLCVVLIVCIAGVARTASAPRKKTRGKFSRWLSSSHEVNVLSAARFFLFGSRDVWFVVGVPVFLSVHVGWGFTAIGTFLAGWVIAYGIVQSVTPWLMAKAKLTSLSRSRAALVLAVTLTFTAVGIAGALAAGLSPATTLLVGLGTYGVVFALNSSVHSYLILAYSNTEDVAKNVGFYYMANAGGRLVGTLLSGILYEVAGVSACLWGSVAFAFVTAGITSTLPKDSTPMSAHGFSATAD
jgi:MFS family permease